MVSTATFSARLAADKAFVDFDRVIAANGITLWTNHTSAELVEYLKGSFITSERKLALELNGRLAGYLCGQKVCAPKPRRERSVARLHNGARRKRYIGFAAATAKHHRRASCETVRLADEAAFLARKTARPSNGLKVASASRVIGEHPLKLWKRGGEAANVHV
jgi:hypothetical protein